ncbi:serine hydrolase domain-containing protein [Fretibacter rubidus]|uniref:serine hydrolase domain-containing protein n=1 Tax=Fretibacter rubidus TaxID=570162 RepID=UPI00352A5DC7
MRDFIRAISAKTTMGMAAMLLSSCADTAAPIAPPTFNTAAMDSLLSAAVEQGEVIGVSALVFDEGQTVYTNAFGLADRERATPMTMDTVLRIYSMTKPVTSAVIMDLMEEGKLSLSDPAAKYIPGLANMQVASLGPDGTPMLNPQENPMTIEDLLLHRAGLGYGIFGPINGVEDAYMKAGLFDPTQTMETVVDKITGLPLLQQPGTAWYYSLSIDVLGRIAEVIEGKPLGDIMQERIFEPLGMTETSFLVRPDQVARFASNYAVTPDGFVLEDDGQDSPFAKPTSRLQSGGGGLVSTLEDYAKFAQMMLDGGIYNGQRILDTGTVEMMMSPVMDADDTYLFPWLGGDTDVGFGYGGAVVYADSPKGQSLRGQTTGQWGWSGAARTQFWVDPKNDAFGIIMLQMFVADDPAIHDAFQALAYAQTRDDLAEANIETAQ